MAVDVKQIALKLAEENAKVVISQIVKPLAMEFIQNSPNKIDDVLLPFIDLLEKALLEAADKIHAEAPKAE
jgi:regulator of PEP synthase PpsR (kinase-PPPase family)